MTDRIGFAFFPGETRASLDVFQRAERAGIDTVWLVMPALGRDTLTMLGAAAAVTERVRLGTAIVPAFTRHPLAIATQAMTLSELAPGRLRLGIGTAHQRTMIPAFGLPFERPLAQLREYVEVLSSLLNTGTVSFEGEFYRSEATLAFAPDVPLLISTLREKAFELAGELTAGAITWLCPIDYLERVGRPALARGAERADRAVPPLIAHTLVAPTTDRAAMLEAAKPMLASYASNPFYRRMFAAAGVPLDDDLAVPDALVDTLVVSGDDDAIAAGLQARLDRGMDELIVSLVPGIDPVADQNSVFRVIAEL